MKPTNVTVLEALRPRSIRPSTDCVEVLLSKDGLEVGQRFMMENGQLLFGRDEPCGVQIASPDVSRYHCLLKRDDGQFILVDTRSTNGVLVNGRRVETQVRLKHGDKIQVNNTVFAFLTPIETTKIFISYGSPDVAFARWLKDALEAQAFDVFFFEDRALDHAGEPIFAVTRGQIAARDVVVLICSAQSLVRAGVQAELKHALAKEEQAGGTTTLVPITLDDAYLRWSEPVLGQAVRQRVVGSFQQWTSSTERDVAVSRLAKRLRSIGQ